MLDSSHSFVPLPVINSRYSSSEYQLPRLNSLAIWRKWFVNSLDTRQHSCISLIPVRQHPCHSRSVVFCHLCGAKPCSLHRHVEAHLRHFRLHFGRNLAASHCSRFTTRSTCVSLHRFVTRFYQYCIISLHAHQCGMTYILYEFRVKCLCLLYRVDLRSNYRTMMGFKFPDLLTNTRWCCPSRDPLDFDVHLDRKLVITFSGGRFIVISSCTYTTLPFHHSSLAYQSINLMLIGFVYWFWNRLTLLYWCACEIGFT